MFRCTEYIMEIQIFLKQDFAFLRFWNTFTSLSVLTLKLNLNIIYAKVKLTRVTSFPCLDIHFRVRLATKFAIACTGRNEQNFLARNSRSQFPTYKTTKSVPVAGWPPLRHCSKLINVYAALVLISVGGSDLRGPYERGECQGTTCA